MTDNGRKRRLGMSPEAQKILRLRNEEIVRLWRDEGQSYATIGLSFGLSKSMIQKIVQEWKQGKQQ
jgi:DNA-binding CsgD family transcriptional regulator